MSSHDNVKDKADILFNRFMTWRLEDSPEFASFIGNYNHDNRLESYAWSDNSLKKETCEKFLQEAKLLEVKAVDSVKKSLNAFIYELQTFISGFQFHGYAAPVNYFEGPQTDFLQIVSYMPKETVKDFQNIIARYKAFPKQADQMIEVMNLGIKNKTTNHISSMHTVLSQFEKLQVPAESSDFYGPFLNLPDTIPAQERAELQKDALLALDQSFLPAMKKLSVFLEKEYIPSCRQNIAANSLPSGDAFYQQCLQFHLSYSMTPKEVHDLGLAEVKRISAVMKQIIESLGHETPVKEFFETIRVDPQFFFKEQKDLLNEYRKMVDDDILPKLPEIFKSMPQSKLSITAMASSQSGGPLAFYLAGSCDGKRPGVFYVNTANLSESPKYEMMSLALHEGLPGHHLQASYLIEVPGLQEFQRYMEDRKYFSTPARFPMHTAYAEGWGLYSEFLGEELGLYSDPYYLLGRLSQEIFRACRLVVDTGMHVFGWTMEEAVAYMLNHSAATKENIEKEVRRYVLWPGQACAYKVGEIRIKTLRKKAEQQLGNKFCLKEFHEVILQNMGPLDILEQEVDKYIQQALG